MPGIRTFTSVLNMFMIAIGSILTIIHNHENSRVYILYLPFLVDSLSRESKGRRHEEMDTFIVVIDILVVLLYSALIALISPYMMRFLQTRNCDRLFQLIPVLSIIFISSVIIFFGYGGSSETLFFQLTSIISFILLLCLLTLTFLVKKKWREKYDKLLTWLSLSKFKEVISSKAK